MGAYEGTYARLYDVFYADKPYDQEAEILDRLLREQTSESTSRRLLDVACGTGQHAVRFARLGWDVLGVDLSADMLEVARERGAGTGAWFVQQDMRAIALPTRDFDAAVCLFDSIGYACTNAAVQATLTGIHSHVRPGGVLAMEFWHAPAMLTGYEPHRIREWSLGSGGHVTRESRTSIDVVAQIATVEYAVIQSDPDGGGRTWREAHRNRFFLIQEMALLLTTSGFTPIRWLAGYDVDREISASTWHVVVIARSDGAE